LHELLWVLGDDLGQLRATCGDLLQDWLKHAWLLLDDLAKLLELWVVAKEVEVSGTSSASSTRGTSAKGCSQTTGSSGTSTTSRTSSTGSRSLLEKVDWLITT
jgi:hypothetical protein